MATTLATMVIKLVGDISSFLDSMDTAQSKISKTGASITNTGQSMSAGVTLPLVGAGVAAFAFGEKFSGGMANVASLGEEAQASIAGWSPQVQEMAIAVGKSTADMTAGLYGTVSAFGVADDTLGVLNQNARAAAAGLATTEQAIGLTSAVTKGWGDTSEAAVGRAADLALTAVQLGQTTFPELASSVGKVVPLMSELGGSQEELFATMATLTGVTGGASEVSTQLRGVLQAMMAPTADMSKLIESMGYESGQAMFESMGLHETILAITSAAEDTGTPLQKFIGSIEGQTAALALSDAQADVYTDKLSAMYDAAGATDEAFAAQTEGVNQAGFMAAQTAVKFQVMAENIGVALMGAIVSVEPVISRLLGYLEGAVNWFTQLSPKTQGTIFAVAGLVAALGPLLVVAGTVVSSIGTLVGLFGTISTAVGLSSVTFGAIAAVLTGPFALAIGLVVGAVALFTAAWNNNWFDIQGKTQVAWEQYIQPALQAMGVWFTETLIPTLQEWYRVWVEEVWPEVSTALQNSWTVISTLFQELGRWINDNLVPWVKVLKEKWGETFDTARSAVADMWESVRPVLENVGVWFQESIPEALGFLADKFGLDFSRIEDVIRGVSDFFRELHDRVKGFWEWISGREFEFNISIPNLPEWATPSSPLPLHTAWKNFDQDLRSMRFQPAITAQPLAAVAGLANENGATGAPFQLNITFEGDVFGMDDFETAVGRAVNRVASDAALLRGAG